MLDLEGQMTLSGEEEPRLLRAIRELVAAGCRHILLNLAQVSYVDSTGVGEIVGAYTRVVREGGILRLCGVSPRTQELLDATNVARVVVSYATEQQALESF